MTRSTITGQPIPGATGVGLFARIAGNYGQLITWGSLTSIAYTVSDLTSGVPVGSGTWSPSLVVLNSLVTGDPRWTIDTEASPGRDGRSGYNFLAVLPAALFPTRAVQPRDLLAGYQPPPVRYQCDVAFTPVTGEPFRVIFSWLEQVGHG